MLGSANLALKQNTDITDITNKYRFKKNPWNPFDQFNSCSIKKAETISGSNNSLQLLVIQSVLGTNKSFNLCLIQMYNHQKHSIKNTKQ
jgi:hypothetical protein